MHVPRVLGQKGQNKITYVNGFYVGSAEATLGCGRVSHVFLAGLSAILSLLFLKFVVGAQICSGCSAPTFTPSRSRPGYGSALNTMCEIHFTKSQG